MNFIYSIVVYCYISFFGRIISYFIDGTSLDAQLSFIGSILGGILSFAGVWITIRYTRKQFKDDKRISVKPYLDIKLNYFNIDKSILSFGNFSINKLKDNKYKHDYEEEDILIEINNLGQGHCLECKLVKIIIDNKNINDEYGYIGNLTVNENILRKIKFKTYYGDIVEKIKKKYIDKNIDDCPEEFKQFTYNHLLKEVELQFEYKDVLDNKYRKTIVIEVFIKFDILAEKHIWEISDMKFNDIYFEINGNLITEEQIK